MIWNRIIIFITVLLLILTTVYQNGRGQTNSDSSWFMSSSCDGSNPIKRHEAAFTRIGEKLYLLGGRGIKPTSIYDISSKTWSKGSAPPVELHHFQPVVYNDKIYVIGALTGGYPDEDPVSHVYIYHPESDNWEKGDTIPSNRRRGSTATVLYKDKIYVANGIENGHISGHKNWLDVYNPETGSWKKLSDSPRPRDHTQGVVIDNKLYIAGGRLSKAPDSTFSLTIPELDIYDFKEDQWTTAKANLPTERAGNMNINFQNQLLVIGGESDSRSDAHDEVQAYNPHNGNWKSLPSLIEGRHGTGAVIYDGKILIASGSGNRGGGPELTSMEIFVPGSTSLSPFITDTSSCN